MSIFNATTPRGFKLGECMSALQKAIRRGDEAAALTFAVEMDQAGQGAILWSRLLVIASEDVGLAEPGLFTEIRSLYETWKDVKVRKNKNMPERLFSTHAVMLLARAKKSRMVDNAVWATYGDPEPLVAEIPDYALDGHTAKGRALGKGSTQETNPEAFHLENAADLGDNPYERRKKATRDRIGFTESKKVFNVQGGSVRANVPLSAHDEGRLL